MGTLFFGFSIYYSATLGIEAARERRESPEAIPPQAEGPVTLGETGDPIYLADSTDSLRTFFTEYPTAESRAAANLQNTGIRRLGGRLDLTTVRAEADAVQVQVSSGPMAGAVYWIHHSQIPGPSAFDPIISPIPDAGN